MAKESGLGITTFSVDASDTTAKAIKNDILSFSLAIPRGIQDISGLDSSAVERLLLLADFDLTMNGVFNDTADASHDVFKNIGSTSVTRTVTIAHSAKSLPNECVLLDYPLTRSATGELTWAVPAKLNSTTVPTWA